MAFLLRLKEIVPPSIQRPLREKAWRTLETLGLQGLMDGSLYAAAEYRRQWRLEEALQCVDRRLREHPIDASAKLMRCRILADMGLHREAIVESKTLLAMDPLNVDAANLLASMGERYEYDMRVVQDILATRGRKSEIYVSALRYLNTGGLFNEAFDLSREAERWPDAQLSAILLERARSLEGQHRYQEAIDTAHTIRPRKMANVKELIARCELELGSPESAARTLGHNPAIRGQSVEHDKTLLPVLYALGDLRSAHLSYRRRPSSRLIARTFNMPSPDGIDLLSGRYRELDAFLFSEAGPGDEIRVSSFYGDLPGYFKSVTITCDPRLKSIFDRSFPAIRFIPVMRYRNELRTEKLSDREGLTDRTFWSFADSFSLKLAAEHDFVCSTLDLLADVRQHPDQFRYNPSRLCASDRRIYGFSQNLKIGIAWRSLLVSGTRNVHYLDVKHLAPLGALTNCEFWNLQAGVTEQERQFLAENLPNYHFLEDIDIKNDFEGLACAIRGLDLVISPPTNIVELAGVLNVPTILLSTSRTTAWRRMLDGTDIWYPNGRVEAAEPSWDRTQLVHQVIRTLQDQQPSETREQSAKTD